MNEDEGKEVPPLGPLVAENANKNIIEGPVPEIVNGSVLTAPRKKALPFSKWLPFIAGAVIGVVLRLVFSGTSGSAYTAMASAFIWLVPMAVGASTVFVAECQTRQSWWFYVTGPIVANTLFVLGTMAILIEGMICAIIIIPLFAVVGALGGLLMGVICRTTNWPRQAVSGFVMLPLLFGAIPASDPDLQRITMLERTIQIQASPEQIWHQLHHAENIQQDEVGQAWMYRIGVPSPLAGITRETPTGLVRTIRMNKAIYFDQVSNDWVKNQYVVWRYHFYPDSFPPNALDDHVMIGGRYFDILDTTYSLKPLNAQTTELKIQMRYRVSTDFNWYADAVARLLITDFEEVILHFYQKRATTILEKT